MRARRRAWWKWAGLGLIGSTYLGSFFLVRKCGTASFFLPESFSQAGCVSLCYFSEDAATNTYLYTLYWPIHRAFGDTEEKLLAVCGQADLEARREMARRHQFGNRSIYIKNIQILEDIGFAL